jgi:hypothetical protein
LITKESGVSKPSPIIRETISQKPTEIAERFVLPEGGITQPFYAFVYEEGVLTYKEIQPSEIPTGKVYKLSEIENESFNKRVEELQRTMTYEQAVRLATDEFTKDIKMVEPVPEVVSKVEPIESVMEETLPETATLPIESTKPQFQPKLYTAKLVEEPRRLKLAKVPSMSLEQEKEYERISRSPAVIQWRQGAKWIMLPPRDDGSYHSEDMQYFDKPLPNTRKFYTGKGSAYKTLDIINGIPKQDADLDLGWTNIHISTKGRELQMSFGGGKEAADSRWAEEQAQMDELSRQSYQELPEEPITEKIKGVRKPKVVQETSDRMLQTDERLNKKLLPEFSKGNVKVYSVNGKYIRDTFGNESIGDRKGIDFVHGGHSGVYWNLIPENEIWIEEDMQPEERDEVVLHELNERNDMLFNKKDYSEAHDLASATEIQARENPTITKELIEREIAEYEAKIKRNQPENLNDTIYVPGYYRQRKMSSSSRPERSSVIVENYRPRTYLGRKLRSSGIADSI